MKKFTKFISVLMILLIATSPVFSTDVNSVLNQNQSENQRNSGDREMDCENFDALTVGGLVADQLGGMWTTWSGTSADDATVSDAYSNSPDNSFVVDAGAVDLVYTFGAEALTTGKWNYSNYIYVPTGFSGYFNVQSEPTPGVAWVIDFYFDDGGAGRFSVDGTDTDFTYAQDTWIMVQINFDLDADMGDVYFDGELVYSFVTANSIGGIDYYGGVSYKSSPSYEFPYTVSDILNLIADSGFCLQKFNEYENDIALGRSYMEEQEIKFPLSYILIARKL